MSIDPLPVLVVAWLLYGSLQAVRIVLVLHVLRRRPPGNETRNAPPLPPITVMQPILSGDRNLRRNLEENLRHHPDAHFLWLIDTDDTEAQELATHLARETAGRPGRIEVLLTPPSPPDRNPKVFKLALGLPRAAEIVAVLDDDTVLPPGSLDRAAAELAGGELVTGLPRYRSEGSFWARLLAAFVNSNALLTYLPILSFRAPLTINGMFYLARRSELEELGGFAAIETGLCDDYELAQLYRRAGRRIVQSTIVHPISTTVRGFEEYAHLLRRWMVFANRLFADRLDALLLVLVVLPALLPLVLVGLAGLVGLAALAWTVAGLLGKASVLALLRWRTMGSTSSGGDLALEVLADLLQPLHAASALVHPQTIRWRGRRIESRGGVVRHVGGREE